MLKPLKILFVTTDLPPFCKAGGLGDVSNSLPKAISDMGHDIRIILPRHGVIDEGANGIKLIRDNIKLKIKDGVEIIFRIKGSVLDGKVPVYFIDKHKYFGGRSKLYGYEDENQRYMFFCFAVIKAIEDMDGWTPDIIHCNDWHTGLIPYLLKAGFNRKEKLSRIKTLFTIHNLTFQMGRDWWKIDKGKQDDGISEIPDFNDKERIDRINFMKRAILSSDIVNTVSERYAEEVSEEKLGQGLHDVLEERMAKKEFYGVLNGIDYMSYNPKTDPGLEANYDENDFVEKKILNKRKIQKDFGLEENDDIPLIAMATRITEQKGFDLILEITDAILRLNLQLVLVGPADPYYRKKFKKISKKNPKKIGVLLKFETKSITGIYAASDMFLMPSRFEPCGLGQMISLRYGSIPIVRETGGLCDTITNFDPATRHGNGFVFKTFNQKALLVAIVRALENYKFKDSWRDLVRKGMRESYSWKIPAKRYIILYNKAIKNKDKKFMYKTITDIDEKIKALSKKEGFILKKPLKEFIEGKKRFYSAPVTKGGKKLFLKARLADDNGSVFALEKEMKITKILTENAQMSGKVNFTKYAGGSFGEIPEWYMHEYVEGRLLGSFYEMPAKNEKEIYAKNAVKNLLGLQGISDVFKAEAEKSGIIKNIKKRGYEDYKNTIGFYRKEKVGNGKVDHEKISDLLEKNKKELDEDLVVAHGDFTLANQIIDERGDVYLSDWESVRIDNMAADLTHLWVQTWRYPAWRKKLLGIFLNELPEARKERFKNIFRITAIEQSLAEIKWNSALCDKKYKKGVIDISIIVIKTALEGFEGLLSM
ncbi:MAG: glycogen/starch synthase [Candidatus Paceibacterota bacterium]|jgi:starch synthase